MGRRETVLAECLDRERIQVRPDTLINRDAVRATKRVHDPRDNDEDGRVHVRFYIGEHDLLLFNNAERLGVRHALAPGERDVEKEREEQSQWLEEYR